MTPAELFYVGGMIVISIGFPSLLVGFWAWDRARLRTVAAKAPRRQPHRHSHAAGAPYSA